MKKHCLVVVFLWLATTVLHAQGKLFIIGGGNRSAALMESMISQARLGPTGYVAVLPMSSGETDTSFIYFRKSLLGVCNNPIVNLNFTAADLGNKPRLDSVANARLIFITGGDQSRFMKLVLNTPVYDAIHRSYEKGGMIAGSSAGAAVMSEQMITGRQLRGDTIVPETINAVRADNIEFSHGLGLVKDAIIDQHFIKRSRYNRLLSALQAYPDKLCIGIDESTAILIEGNKVKVFGEGQVLVFSKPEGLKVGPGGLISFSDIRLSMLVAGAEFSMKEVDAVKDSRH